MKARSVGETGPMAEGLSPAEVGKEIGEHTHRSHSGDRLEDRHDGVITIVEAVLLAIVALLAAWSGFSASKWSTESRVFLAAASAARTQSSAAQIEGLEQRNFDSSTFDAWFTAYTLGDPAAMELAARRFRPEFRVAFDAWQATDPANNAQAPPGPTFMDEYEQPFIERAAELDERATAKFEAGEEAGQNADKYVQTTVYLATVLFLVGISGHFRVRKARIGLVAVGGVVLTVAVITLATLPGLP